MPALTVFIMAPRAAPLLGRSALVPKRRVQLGRYCQDEASYLGGVWQMCRLDSGAACTALGFARAL